jgi:inhibitor of KinA sporulation pathway (predicted exonuclease)
MSDYDQEKWVEVYKTALMELEHAAMTGRISDARTAISSRLEKLKQLPGLHGQEYQAIEDALNNLRVLEREEKSFAEAEKKKRALEDALQKLRSLAPRFRQFE